MKIAEYPPSQFIFQIADSHLERDHIPCKAALLQVLKMVENGSSYIVTCIATQHV